ncbi:endonuclease MutS2 [Gottschalkia purinilytica]|uniref:Endonuclease MutS2 n=1 Tax=Gottschalkia purinilytica TaxID=1503 RepID=A0A0L0WA43_GOTPU|nr:hypothetical protein [Gottschalkia purinilytica]KNF08331.1 endonuclease MutS2 [Gottschalkia purinilytica]
MNEKSIEILEYNKIKEQLKGFALSDIAKERIDRLEPSVDIKVIEKDMKETSEARAIIDITSSIPINSLKGIKQIKEKLEKGAILSPEDLESVSDLLREIERLKRFMKDKEYNAPTITTFARSTYELYTIREEIDRCILRGRVDDRASSKLSKVRKRINILEDRIKSKLDGILKNESYKGYMQDHLVSQRGGRYVIPVKSEYKRQVDGEIHDKSQTGSTLFIEPKEIKKIQDELNICKIEEEKEVYKILSYLTDILFNNKKELNINIEAMAYYDFIFAKGKYSKSIDGEEVSFNNRNYINIKRGRHPLIGKEAVPLDFTVGENYQGVIITGPNTGGKTVALKTVGLLTMMAQSGLHVPVDKESEFGVFIDVLVDIGDGQSIEHSLSTFSSHIKNIINILHCADKHTLVIMDEVGSGTDPAEGMGIATAILEKLYDKGATICATTHYSEIKYFAQDHPGFINGSMAFDIETLRPLYKLNIGKAGESNAFLIALRLGMSKDIIEKAHQVTYKEYKDYSNYEYKKDESKETLDKDIVKSHKEQKVKFKEAKERSKISEGLNKTSEFAIGDSVYVSSMKKTGVVCELENSKGEYTVMIMNKKLKINKKRLSLHIKKEELYPEDYDLDVVLKSKEYRKKDKMMKKKHVKGVVIDVDNEN